MKVLFIGSVLPFPAHTGTRVSQLIHLNELRSAPDLEITAAFFDGDRTGLAGQPEIAQLAPKVVTIEPRPFARRFWPWLGRRLFGTSLPTPIFDRASPTARATLSRLCREDRFDVIVADAIESLGLIPVPRPRNFPPIVLITHNVEIMVHLNLFRLSPPLRALQLLALNNTLKTFLWERTYFSRCAKTVFISPHDFAQACRVYRLDPASPKFAVCQDLLPMAAKRWRPANQRRLLFVGTLGYAPNLDAALWLVRTLAPALERHAPEFRIAIAGSTSDPGFAAAALRQKNVEVHGWIGDEALEELIVSSALFISPVVQGSGVKMKLLKALSYGLPLLATRHCLEGLDFLGPEFAFERDDATETVARIIALVRDPVALAGASQRITLAAERALAERGPRLVQAVRLAAVP